MSTPMGTVIDFNVKIGQGPDDWYGNNGAAQCITIYVTPFSH